jgi:hypothetical protein
VPATRLRRRVVALVVAGTEGELTHGPDDEEPRGFVGLDCVPLLWCVLQGRPLSQAIVTWLSNSRTVTL